MSKEKKNSSLIEIRDILKEEMDKFTSMNNEIIDNQNDFEKITENYNKYDNLIDKGKSHITDLNRQEIIENLFIYIGYYFFFACVIYVLLKRFPIHKIIGFFFKLLKKIISPKIICFTTINSQFNLSLKIFDWGLFFNNSE